jgi:hypothetical protein
VNHLGLRWGLFAPSGLIGALAQPGSHPRDPSLALVAFDPSVPFGPSYDALSLAHRLKWTQEDLKTSSPPSRLIG